MSAGAEAKLISRLPAAVRRDWATLAEPPPDSAEFDHSAVADPRHRFRYPPAAPRRAHPALPDPH
jgi:hypothetical protein